MAEPKKKPARPATVDKQTVVIELKGNQSANSDCVTRLDGVEVIELHGGEMVTWKNTGASQCTVKFTEGGCPFDHGHEQCRFTVAPRKTRAGDVVRESHERKVFVFSVEFEKPSDDDQAGTPQIIVQRRSQER